MLAPVHRARLWLAGLGALVLFALLGTLSGDWLYGEDPLGLVASSLGWHHEAALVDVPLESFLPGQKRDLSPTQAYAENLASPLERDNPAPPPFIPAWLSAEGFAKADACMASAIYSEAAGEAEGGQLAVAQVILNRLRHPRFPKSVCDVVYQGSDRPSGCQFTFACDGSLARRPDAKGLAHARAVADLALHGATSLLAGQATHYHTVWIVPVWARKMRKVAIVGHHVFYRPPGSYGAYPLLGDAERKGDATQAAMAPQAVVETHGPGGHAAAMIGNPLPEPAPFLAPGRGDHDGGGAGSATLPSAPATGSGDRRRFYFATPRHREGALALPNAP